MNNGKSKETCAVSPSCDEVSLQRIVCWRTDSETGLQLTGIPHSAAVNLKPVSNVRLGVCWLKQACLVMAMTSSVELL